MNERRNDPNNLQEISKMTKIKKRKICEVRKKFKKRQQRKLPRKSVLKINENNE